MERRYVVPLFQRPYVWNRPRQWEPLWADITSKADRVLSYGDSRDQHIRKHFLGAVVISQIRTFGRQVSAVDVIDGQQRLTTLQIILCALRDFATLNGFDETLTELKRATENTCRREKEFETYKVWPTTSDRPVYESVLTAKSPEEVRKRHPLTWAKYARKPSPLPLLVDAYLFFYESIESYVNDGAEIAEEGSDPPVLPTPEKETRLDSLIDAITDYMELVIIELEERDDPQVIFETLNARGEPLLPSDLLRNFVFLEATRAGEDVDRLYHTYWSAFDDPSDQFWKAQQTIGRFKRSRMDVFVFHYLVSKTGLDISINHLYQEFRNWWLSAQTVVENGLKGIKDASSTYRRLVQPPESDRLALFCARLALMDTGTVHPVLLFLTDAGVGCVPEGALAGIVETLESYLVRRMICRMTPKNYNRVFLTLLRSMRDRMERGETIDRAFVRRALSEPQGDSVRWPSDSEFRDAWLTRPAYTDLQSSRATMILRALDLQMETSKQEELHLPGALSVEHVMPQNGSEEDWPIRLREEDGGDPTRAMAERTRVIHTLGNLTLLTQPLNSSVSNGPFSAKRPEIAKQSRLRLNAYFQDFTNDDSWSEDSIWERGQKLFEVAKQVWPGPDEPV
ncbi:MAG TPA: DUF262 domain-containing protein, partial [Chloroflexota bacterium]|nr:DUF262 domain-containing protein [Chloroflexota bacterium]